MVIEYLRGSYFWKQNMLEGGLEIPKYLTLRAFYLENRYFTFFFSWVGEKAESE